MSATLAAPRAGPFRRLLENPGAVGGLAVMAVLIVLAVAAPIAAPHGPAEQFREHFLAPPFQQATFPLGTDSLGRNILTRLIYGARLSLLIGAVVVALSLSAGTLLGLVAAFAGGALDVAIMRLMDVLLVFPSLLLAIVVVAILGPGLTNAMLAVAVVLLPGYVRLSRAAALGELTREYVVATRSAGAGVLRLMLLVVLPNCLAPQIVQATLGFSAAILDALPERAEGKPRLPTIPGVVPGADDRPAGCLFAPRCRFRTPHCDAERPALRMAFGARVRCHYPLDDAGQPTGRPA